MTNKVPASIPTLNAIAGQGYSGMPLVGSAAGAIAGSMIGQHDDIAGLYGRGLSIRIVPANGGTIVNIRNENNPGLSGDLYVVGADQDIGEELGKIITMHYLKKE